MFRPVQKFAVQRNFRRLAGSAGPQADGPSLREKAERELDVIVLARKFNAGQGALTCIVLLLLAWSITGSFAAGFFAGLLAAFNPWHIEHCHYAETDIAMVFTLSVALLLWSRAQKASGQWFFAAASLASGFAAGTKYPLILLVALVATHARRPENGKHLRRRAAWTAVFGLLLFLLGFVWANPAALLDPRWFIAGFHEAGAGVAAESAGVIGKAAGQPFARAMHQLRWMTRFLLAHGFVWTAMTLTGAGLLLIRRFRRYWRTTFLFPVLYTIYIIGLAPWIRMQEILVFMPLAACAAGAAASVAIRWMRSQAGNRALRLSATAAVAVAVCAVMLVQGIRRTNLFTHVDTRHDAETWLQTHLPRGEVVGAEIYTKSRPGHPVPVRELVPISKMEWKGIEHAHAEGCSYLLRNRTMPGRGAFDPFTGNLYADFDQRRRMFLDSSELLVTWSPIDPENEVTFAFCNSELGLYGLRTRNETISLEAPLTSPCRLLEDGRGAIYPAGRLLGTGTGIVVDRKTRSLRVGGPTIPEHGVYLVLRRLDGNTLVLIRGFGRRISVNPANDDARAINLNRCGPAPRLERFEKIRIRADSEDCCLVQVVFERWEAAAILLESGLSGQALRLLDIDRANANEQTVRFLAAVKNEQAPRRADILQAEETLAGLKAAMKRPAEDLRINGVHGFYYDRFARVYLGSRDTACSGELKQKLLLPAGTWRFRVETGTSTDSTWHTVDTQVKATGPQVFDLGMAGLREDLPAYRNAEISWTLQDRMLELRNRLERALKETAESFPVTGEEQNRR